MRQITSLQVFRGLAALAVVMYHGSMSTSTYVAPVPPTAAAIFGQGYLGVDFFFVLSGFIIMYAHSGDGRSLDAVRRYTFKRLVRIFPAYLPLAIALIALYAAFPGFSFNGAPDYSLSSSLLLVPADRPPVLSVAWTLVHELLFYTIFLLFFVSRRLFVYSLIGWASLIVATNIIAGDMVNDPTNWLRYPLSILNMEFMLGVVAAWMVTSSVVACKPSWLIAGGVVMAASLLSAMEISGIAFLRLGFAAGLALMIVGVARWERTNSPGWPVILVLMGNASYSIYLVHNPVFSVAQRLSKQAGFNWVGGLIAGVAMAVAAGYVYHIALERRAVRFFGGRIRRKPVAAACPTRTV